MKRKLPPLPKSLKIGGHRIVVKTGSVTADDYGEYDALAGTIIIHQELPPSKQWSILIHEIFHVLNSTFGYEEANETTINHMLLDSLAEQFFQVLADNRLL